jgi:hypothetical protein
MSIFSKKPPPVAPPPPAPTPVHKQESRTERLYKAKVAELEQKELEEMAKEKPPKPLAVEGYEEDFVVYGSERNKKAKISIKITRY